MQEGCVALGQALASRKVCPDLEALYLSGNSKIGDDGLQAIGPILGRLQRLHLDNCSIADRGCKFLAKTMGYQGCRLSELWLSGNVIGDKGCDALGRMLAPRACYRTLRLLDCPRIGDEAKSRMQSIAKERQWAVEF